MDSSMVIAVNMLFFLKENESAYFKRIVEALILRNPSHTFIILYEKVHPIEAFTNVQFFNTALAPQSIERWNIWMYFKIKKVRKLYNPGVLINNGEALIIPRDLPQILLYPDLGYLQDSKRYSRRFLRFSRLFTPAFIKKQSVILLLSSFEKEIIIKHYAVEENRIKVVVSPVEKNRILPDWEEKENIKEKYANGFEYFLYSGPVSSEKGLMNLIKGFSAFKKRQKSSMQLLITGREAIHFREFKKALELYKYRSDVHIIPYINIQEHRELISSAYALVFCYAFDNNVMDLLTSLACQVPAIVPEKGTLHEVGREGVLPYETGNIPDLAGKMMLLFKDEKYRKKLIENPSSRIDETNIDKGIEEIWETLESSFRH